MASNVSEKEARQVAEAAREQDWKLPELRQGALPRQLPARPDPPAAAGSTPQAVEKGEAFLAHAARVPRRARSTRCEIERDAKIPDDVVDGPQGARRARHEDPRASTAASASRRSTTTSALALAGVVARRRSARCSRRTSRSACRAAEAVRHRGAEAASACRASRATDISAFLLTEPDVGSDPARLATTADADRGRLRPQRREAVGDQRRDRRPRRGDGAGAEVRRPPGRHHRVRRRVRRPTASRSSTATQFMGLRGIENAVTPLRGRLRAGRRT